LQQVLDIDRQIEEGIPTYLYLTDYSSLYVADLGAIEPDSGRQDRRVGVPEYYQALECDAWFKIWDILRLVADDTRGVVQELRRLRNTRYFDQPVSLYGGIVDLPLIVWHDIEVDWFGSRSALMDSRLWAERDSEAHSDSQRVLHELRDNLFGSTLWGLMETVTRTFLASGDAEVRSRREDHRFDFTGPAVQYAKAMEAEANAVIMGLLHKALHDRKPKDRLINCDGRQVDLGKPFQHLSLGTLARLLQSDPTVRNTLRTVAPADANYFTDPYQLSKQLDEIAMFRNPAAHETPMSRRDLLEFRDRFLGIGHMGWLPELARRKILVRK
jgi:hypothetical protein